MQFSSCRGKDYCTEGGTHCEGCGRSHEEIARTRELVGAVAAYALEMGYENYQDFAAFIGDMAARKVGAAQQQTDGIGAPVGITLNPK